MTNYIDLLNEDLQQVDLYAKQEDKAIGIYNKSGYLVYIADNERMAHTFFHGIKYNQQKEI